MYLFPLRLRAVLILTTVLVLCAPGAQASVLGNEACQALVREGIALVSAGKVREALEAYQKANKADPTASAPLSAIAGLLYKLSLSTSGEDAARFEKQARDTVRQALALGPDDPMAQEVLRNLTDKQPPPLHVAAPEVIKLCNEGDALLFGGNYPQALEKYEAALRLDPQYSTAAVFAGDVFYKQRNWQEAESRFRQAAGIEPLNAQAWRFLSDALLAQGKSADADKALLAAIAAQPSQLPSWGKLASLRAKAGFPLTPLKLRELAQAHLDPVTHKPVVALDSSLTSDAATPDRAIWMMYGIAKANALVEAQKTAQQPSAFAVDLAAWQAAMQVADEEEAVAKAPQLADPVLLRLQKLYRAGQLAPAILILAYHESYRPDWESWKQEHPTGLAAFIDTYGLRP